MGMNMDSNAADSGESPPVTLDGDEQQAKSRIDYRVADIPPWHISLVYGLQQILANISGPLSTVYMIHLLLCTEGRDSDLLFAQMLSTSIFMMGVASLLQCTFGVRLPIVQGSSTSFVAPIAAMMATEQWMCTELPGNGTITSTMGTSSEFEDEPWIPRLRIISGSLTAAAVIQMLLGFTGALGFLTNYIGPLTICPTVSLVGLSLFETATAGAQHQWGIAVLTVALMVIFSLILCEIKLPLPTYNGKTKGWRLDYYRFFKLYPHIFSIGIAWLLCYILTVTDVFPNDPNHHSYLARTDAKLDVIDKAAWFYFPYPGQWGLPTFSVGVFVGMLAATVASIIESIGDYYATATAANERPPPKHAINRGIAMEGFASILSGLVGASHATTSYSGTVGFIGITGVASRFVWQVMSLMFIVFGLFGKFGAALTIIPDPIIGGLTVIGLGMVISIGFSVLQYIDMNSSRNLMVLAVSFMLGMMVPFYLQDNPGIIQTGNGNLDQALTVFLSTGMFVGGVIGFLLDNIIPGTKEERGMLQMKLRMVDATNPVEESENETETTDPFGRTVEKSENESETTNPMDRTESISSTAPQQDVYDLPWINDCLNRATCSKYVPFLPAYDESIYHLPKKCSCCKQADQKGTVDHNGANIEYVKECNGLPLGNLTDISTDKSSDTVTSYL